MNMHTRPTPTHRVCVLDLDWIFQFCAEQFETGLSSNFLSNLARVLYDFFLLLRGGHSEISIMMDTFIYFFSHLFSFFSLSCPDSMVRCGYNVALSAASHNRKKWVQDASEESCVMMCIAVACKLMCMMCKLDDIMWTEG